MTETNFGKKLRKKLTEAGWMYEKIPCGRFKQGFPDCILIDPEGVVVFAELKVGFNPVSQLQKKKLKQLANQGAVAMVIRLNDELEIRDHSGGYEFPFWIEKEIIRIWESK